MEISKTCVLHAIGLVGGSCEEEANERNIPVLRYFCVFCSNVKKRRKKENKERNDKLNNFYFDS